MSYYDMNYTFTNPVKIFFTVGHLVGTVHTHFEMLHEINFNQIGAPTPHF